MSQQADIDGVFHQAIDKAPDNERTLLMIKLEVYESLEWDSAVETTLRELQEKGYPIPPWYTNEQF